jgi:hypothetical protein
VAGLAALGVVVLRAGRAVGAVGRVFGAVLLGFADEDGSEEGEGRNHVLGDSC